jgi:hypothetical protein
VPVPVPVHVIGRHFHASTHVVDGFSQRLKYKGRGTLHKMCRTNCIKEYDVTE